MDYARFAKGVFSDQLESDQGIFFGFTSAVNGYDNKKLQLKNYNFKSLTARFAKSARINFNKKVLN
jgi:hypothetical protein